MMMHRLTRYSIRSLLVLVTLACVGLGWYVFNYKQRQREVAALDRIEQLYRPSEASVHRIVYGIARREERSFCVNGLGGSAMQRRLGPKWLDAWLAAWDQGVTLRVEELSLHNVTDDRAIPHLAQLESLESLTIKRSRLTAEGERRLRSLLPDTTIRLMPSSLE